MSAQGYTNRVRTLAEARNNKVQQIGNIATNYVPIQATACVSPDYSVLNYKIVYCGGRFKPPCLKQ